MSMGIAYKPGTQTITGTVIADQGVPPWIVAGPDEPGAPSNAVLAVQGIPGMQPVAVMGAVPLVIGGSIVANGGIVEYNQQLGGYGVLVAIQGVYSTGSTLQFEATPDNNVWVPIMAARTDNGAVGTSVSPLTNATACYVVDLAGMEFFRVRCSAWAAPTGAIGISIFSYSLPNHPVSVVQLANSGGGISNGGATTDAAGTPSNPLAATAYNDVWNGASWDRARSLGAAGDGLGVTLALPPSSSPVSANAANGATATVTLAAVAAQRNRLTMLNFSVIGTVLGTVTVQVKDGAAVVLDYDVTAFGDYSINIPAGGIKGTVNTAMTVTAVSPSTGTVKVNAASLTA